MCGKVCAQKTRLRAGKPAGKAWLSPGFLTRPGSRSCARSSHCPASLSHGPTGLWEPFPPAWPGKARPCQGSALRTACTPPQRRALTRRKTGGQSLAFSGSLTHPGCPSNTENRHAVSRILAGTKQHAPDSSCNILPGSAPALRGVILYPFSPLPLPLTHPITLTPNMERTRMRQHLLHIPAQTLPFSAHLAAK